MDFTVKFTAILTITHHRSCIYVANYINALAVFVLGLFEPAVSTTLGEFFYIG
jgi:hypothetical protein